MEEIKKTTTSNHIRDPNIKYVLANEYNHMMRYFNIIDKTLIKYKQMIPPSVAQQTPEQQELLRKIVSEHQNIYSIIQEWIPFADGIVRAVQDGTFDPSMVDQHWELRGVQEKTQPQTDTSEESPTPRR